MTPKPNWEYIKYTNNWHIWKCTKCENYVNTKHKVELLTVPCAGCNNER